MYKCSECKNSKTDKCNTCLSSNDYPYTKPSMFKSKSELLNIDNVNHPNHYLKGGIETIDIIANQTGEGFNYYLEGNIIKYLSRYRYKNGIEDLKKAQWYLNKLIEVTSHE